MENENDNDNITTFSIYQEITMSTPKKNLVHVNVRLPQYVIDYFKQQPSYTRAMREALKQHVEAQDGK